MSLARQHKAYHEALRLTAAVPVADDGSVPADVAIVVGGDDPIAFARLTHDLRCLADMQSMERRVEGKRAMLPEYDDAIAAQLRVGDETGAGIQGDVLPTIMVWRIDVGDYDRALELAAYVLRHDIALPPRFKRSPATLVTEMIADAAIERLAKGEAFDLDVLHLVDDLTADRDMPDEVRAKLCKATGFELLRQADAAKDGNGAAGLEQAATAAALPFLLRARDLDPRSGVVVRIRSIEAAEKKRLASIGPTTASTDAGQGGTTPPPAG